MSNFTFLNKKWSSLGKLGMQAENYLHTDNNASMLKMRMFGEQIIDLVLAGLNIEVDRFATQDDKIKLLRNAKINQSIPDLFDIVRRYGNKANHEGYENKNDALECLVSMYKVAAWFYIKVTKDTSIKPLTFKVPKSKNSKVPIYSIEDYANEKEQIKEILKQLNETPHFNTTLLFKTPENQTQLSKLAPYTKDYPIGDQPTYYLCSNGTCQAPTSSLESLKNIL